MRGLLWRHGLRTIREAIGPDSYLLGCGAPDPAQRRAWSTPCAWGRTSDITSNPLDGTSPSPPSGRPRRTAGGGRGSTGRFWTNDADCLVAGTHVERREDWAEIVERYSGLRASSDRLRGLDEWGLETTRRLLRAGLTAPFVP